MYRILFTLLLAILCQSTYAQKKAFKNGFSLRLHYYLPGEHFEEADLDAENYELDLYRRQANGFGFQIGNMFYLNGIPLGERWRLGIDAAYLKNTFVRSRYTPLDPNEEDAEGFSYYITTEVGPFISYSPRSDMAIDAVVRFGPQLVLGWAIPGNGGRLGETAALNLRTIPAVYYHYKIFMAGVEGSIGRLGHPSQQSGSGIGFTSYRLVAGFKF
ncbi:hypothetical protein KFE98_05195 [bacterium SCSIO 12741]|nr:hypothetical protein KFE98_05195 [bacterium SCSIO 12741]